MEKTDAAVATVADKLGDKALQYLTSFEELAKQYSPDVVDAGLTVVRVHGFQSIGEGALALILVISCIWIIRINIPKVERYSVAPDALIATSSIVGIFSAIGVWANLLNIWNWIAIFDPKLYIAYKIFGKLF
jgi:hypothetical protein